MEQQERQDGRCDPGRAAQYVRMSTEHQRYSTANQAKAIAEYAVSHSLTIVRTYADEGKSGLSFEGRDALKRLIADVVCGAADFDTVLVYDVSRWGRFQDHDESAYYEFICKKAGVRVCYCAEPFENDESLTSSILKSIKRAMAAEYSRELSKKTFDGTSRIVRLGFHSGGIAGYGLRRLLVNPDRIPIAQLERGQRKALHTDRVILIPGPPEEVRTIRRIFYQYVHEGKSATEIAAKLSSDHVPFPTGKSWNYLTIRRILKNEVYIGNNVYNRHSGKFRSKTKVLNPPQEWVRTDGAFKPIVSTELFHAAKRLMNRKRHHSKDEMLDMLRDLLARKGYLSLRLITATDGMPHPSSYQYRFGNLRSAFRLIGYTNPRDAQRIDGAEARTLLKSVFAQVGNFIKAGGGTARGDTRHYFFVVNENTTISVTTGKCVHFYYRTRPYWKAHVGRRKFRPDFAIVARMKEGNRSIKDYYFLPKSELQSEFCLLGTKNRAYLEAYRHKSLDFVTDFVADGCTLTYFLENDRAVSERCKQLRHVMEFSQSSTFAKFVGVSPQRWNNVETGLPLSKNLAMTLTRKIPGLTLDWLYRGLGGGMPPDLATRLGAS